MRLIKDNVERVSDNEATISRLIALGFKGVSDFGDGIITENNGNKDIDKMTVAELKAMAKEKGIEGAASLTKTELLTVLKDALKDVNPDD